jgi:chromosome partitioning protein
MRVTVGNLKGGAAKTTTAVYLALGLAGHGRTLLIDADPQQSSALRWSELAADDWPGNCVVIPWASRDLARRVNEVADDYAHIVIDSGPKNPQLLRQALTVTDQLLIPTAPRPLELAELAATFDLAADVDAIHPLQAAVLLVQVRARTRSAADTRDLLTDMKLPVLDAEIRLRESYALAYGTVPTDSAEYGPVLDELRSN